MTKQDKIKYLNVIKKAYKVIKDKKNNENVEHNYPDYTKNYEIESDFTINLNGDFEQTCVG